MAQWMEGNNTLLPNANRVIASFIFKIMLIQQNDSNCVEHCQYSKLILRYPDLYNILHKNEMLEMEANCMTGYGTYVYEARYRLPS